jgi:1-acyl-sn-glycerol-3-phosphate acyltransferase
MKQKASEGVLEAGQVKNYSVLLTEPVALAPIWVIVSVQWGIRLLSRAIMPFFFSLEVRGETGIDVSKPVIIISNHKSYYDVLILANSLNLNSKVYPLWFIAKDQFFTNPVSKFLFQIMGCCPSYYGHGLDRSLQTPKDLLRANQTLVFFPEGKCIRQELLGQPKPGTATLLLQMPDVQILPIAIRNSYKIGSAGFFERAKVKSHIGKPFLLKEKIDIYSANVNSIGDLLMSEIENLYKTI